jgi:hypothetical protein
MTTRSPGWQRRPSSCSISSGVSSRITASTAASRSPRELELLHGESDGRR